MHQAVTDFRGSATNPVEISTADYWHLREQFDAMEARYDALPPEQREAYRQKCRTLILRQYPWAFDNVHCRVIGDPLSDWAALEAAVLTVQHNQLTRR